MKLNSTEIELDQNLQLARHQQKNDINKIDTRHVGVFVFSLKKLKSKINVTDIENKKVRKRDKKPVRP